MAEGAGFGRQAGNSVSRRPVSEEEAVRLSKYSAAREVPIEQPETGSHVDR